MSHPDLNLLLALDVLLAEGSVAGAARRLRLSPSAMSRTLTRLREATGDPLLVRAGRELAPTPRAVELRASVGALVREAEAALRPAEVVALDRLARAFTLRASDGFVETFGPRLIARVGREAPGVQITFLRKVDRDSAPLRDGLVDLETGVVGARSGPELRAQALFRDRFVAVVREGHALIEGELTAARFADARHVRVARRAGERGPVDAALGALGLERRVVVTVDGYAQALALVRAADVVATVPERHTAGLREGLRALATPFAAPEITISLLWHPRMDADPAHRWLRSCVLAACAGDAP